MNFAGDVAGSPSIYRSYNVSSITDRGNAQYTVNFTTAFSDRNYSWGGGISFDNVANASGYIGAPFSTARTTWKTTSAIQINAFAGNTSYHGSDPAELCFIAFGDQ